MYKGVIFFSHIKSPATAISLYLWLFGLVVQVTYTIDKLENASLSLDPIIPA
jgi:hypothetical protein